MTKELGADPALARWAEPQERLVASRIDQGEGFTPGPWDRRGDTIVGKTDSIAVMHEMAVRRDADARLIVSAPDLYEALAEMHRACLGEPVGASDGYGTCVAGNPSGPTLNKANAALRKARGEVA